jgi:hypothetical protein
VIGTLILWAQDGWLLAGAVLSVQTGRRLPMAASVVCSLVADLMIREWLLAAAIAVCSVIVFGRDWWDRRGRKAAREFGAKSRARVAALADALRDLGSPAPEGAR